MYVLFNTECLFVHQLFEDFALVRPTIISSTPRFWNLVYNQYLNVRYQEYKLYLKSISELRDRVQEGQDNVTALTPQELVSVLVEDDVSNATKCIDSLHVPEEVHKMAIKKISSVLGGRQRLVSTGGAPTAPAVMEFLEECFDGLFHEGYGASEVNIYIHCIMLDQAYPILYLFRTSVFQTNRMQIIQATLCIHIDSYEYAHSLRTSYYKYIYMPRTHCFYDSVNLYFT